MYRTQILSLIVVVGGIAATLTTAARSQIGAPKATVNLQPTTPGTSQSGHSNISGTSRAGQFVGGGAGLTGVNAAQLGGLPASSYLTGIPNPLNLAGNTDGVAVINASNTAVNNQLAISATIPGGFAATINSAAVKGAVTQAETTLAAGVLGENAGNGPGVRGLGAVGVEGRGGYQGVYGVGGPGTFETYGGYFSSSSQVGVGVYGEATVLSGATTGGYFVSNSDNGTGVRGAAIPAGSQLGYGGYFTNSGNQGAGVVGIASRQVGSTYGGRFINSSVNGIGVYCTSSALSGSAISGLFDANSPSGYGLISINNATSGAAFGANIVSLSVDGRAIYGEARNTSGTSYGVAGQTYSTTGGFGIWGAAPPSGYAVFGQGRLSATTKLFTIDHPLDPENKYLLHYCEEGPEPLNVYSGKVSTDSNGYATVKLPEYFLEINKDPRVQLTVWDEGDTNEFVQAKVVGNISSAFRIRTSAGGVTVFWRVEGVRNDRWMQKYGAPVEVDKPVGQRGKYIHPELYGQPDELGLNYNGGASGQRPFSKP